MRCSYCTRDVPDAPFCTWCGRHQATNGSRLAHYAAHPGEHVLHPSVLTTLFPHLGHQKVHEFRWALAAGVACLLLLDLAGLITAALLCAAFLVPILYLIYLYEVQVYRDEPAPVLGFTIGGGVVLGIVVTISVKAVTGPVALQTIYGDDVPALLVLGVLVPLIQELLKPLPALALRLHGGFPERVDGLVFGVAAGLGFSIAETLVRFSAVLTSLPAHTAPANWIYPLLTLAILMPLLQGSATGAITAALWRVKHRGLSVHESSVVILALAAHMAFIVGSQMLVDRQFSQLFVLAWQAVVVGALLLVIRYLLHQTLLEEARDLGFSELVCPNCHQPIVAARFCPLCGKALVASAPKRVSPQPRRPAPSAGPALEEV
jgi:RsiW-degrading membrane proteinase PrsW (M82 family)